MSRPTDQETTLRRILRDARALADEETPRAEDAMALAHAFRALGPPDSGDGSAGEEARVRERARRVLIVALRRKAEALRGTWVAGLRDDATADDGGDAAAPDPLAQAEALTEAALALHSEWDVARAATEYLLGFLRMTRGLAAMPSRATTRQDADASPAGSLIPAPVGPESLTEPADRPVVAATPEQPLVTPVPDGPTAAPTVERPAATPTADEPAGWPTPEPQAGAPARRIARPSPMAMAAAAAALTLVLGVVVAGARGWKAGALPASRDVSSGAVLPAETAAADTPQAAEAPTVPAPAGQAAGEAQAGTGASPAGDPQAAPPPQAAAPPPPSPAVTPRLVTVIIRSDPAGAQVLIGGAAAGTTPLRLERPPGTTLQVTIRRGDRVWRGTLRVGERAEQVVTVRLPQPVGQAVPAATPARTATPDVRRHFEALMTQGIQLYEEGWYGPALGRFRTAAGVMPNSPRAHLWIGRAAWRSGRDAEARQALERVIALAPESQAAQEARALLRRMN